MFESSSSAGQLAASAVELDRLDGLVDQIGWLEAQIAGLQARQLLVTAELVEGCRVLETGSAMRWSTASHTAVSMQVAAARRVSLDAAERYVAHAVRLATDLPAVLDVLEAGLTTLDAVRSVCREAVNIGYRDVARFDGLVADDLLGLEVASQGGSRHADERSSSTPTRPTTPRRQLAGSGTSRSGQASGSPPPR